MKLLNCLKCNDILKMQWYERKCACGRCAGKYVSDIDVAFTGPGRILAILNTDYTKSLEPSTIYGSIFHVITISDKDPAVIHSESLEVEPWSVAKKSEDEQ